MKYGARIYVVKADHAVKVGITSMPIEHRIRDLERASGLHLEVAQVFEVDSRARAYNVEQVAHWLLRDSRTIGEWFACTAADAVAAIQGVLDDGIPLDYYRRDQAAVA